MSELLKVTSNAIEMTWDPATRLASIRFAAETRATGPDAVLLVQAMTRWVGSDGAPFGLLGDGGKLGAVDAEYRAVWGRFFRVHSKASAIAFYNMGPVIRVAAEMFRIGTGLRLKAFANEADARAWLRQAGIDA